MDSPENRSAHTRAYDDVERTLRKLKNLGKTISIITGAPHFIAQMEIEKLNGAAYDLYFSIYDSKFDEKPDAKSFLFALAKLNARPKDTVYIGNSNEDAYYAKNALELTLYILKEKNMNLIWAIMLLPSSTL